MFVGRKRELEFLNRIYSSPKFEFVVVYGRRRLGKTALIKEFIKDKRTIYMMATQSKADQNLKSLSSAVMTYLTGTESFGSYSDFEEALRQCFEISKKQKLILAIDEYPFAAKSDPSLNSILQKLIDEYKDESQLKLILCGSLITYIEDEMFAYKAPLYGRKTGQIKLNPFSFQEVRMMFPTLDALSQANVYGVFGGTPFYLEFYNPEMPLMQNIQETFFTSNSVIKEEPRGLLRQEMRDPELYDSILQAIASGCSRINQISDFAGLPTSNTTKAVSKLIEMDLVEKRTPSGENRKTKTLYQIKDPMFMFWYANIPDNESRIALGATRNLIRETQLKLPSYMGFIFEKICIEYLWEKAKADECPVYFKDLGPWWGPNSQTKMEEEIDIVGVENKSKALFAECKWTNEPVGLPVLRTLERRSSLFSQPEKILYIFSKSGFKDDIQKEAEARPDLRLVDFENIISFFDRCQCTNADET